MDTVGNKQKDGAGEIPQDAGAEGKNEGVQGGAASVAATPGNLVGAREESTGVDLGGLQARHHPP